MCVVFFTISNGCVDGCVGVTISFRHRKTCVCRHIIQAPVDMCVIVIQAQGDMCVVDMWAMEVSPLAVEPSEGRLIEGDAGNSRTERLAQATPGIVGQSAY